MISQISSPTLRSDTLETLLTATSNPSMLVHYESELFSLLEGLPPTKERSHMLSLLISQAASHRHAMIPKHTERMLDFAAKDLAKRADEQGAFQMLQDISRLCAYRKIPFVKVLDTMLATIDTSHERNAKYAELLAHVKESEGRLGGNIEALEQVMAVESE